mgnify:CR=1 FL=1
MSVDLTPLALPALLAAGAALTLISARTALPGPISLTTSLLAAALLTGAYFFAIDHLISAMAFALAAGAGAAAAAIDARCRVWIGRNWILDPGICIMTQRDGFSLIEALAATALLSIAMIPIYDMLSALHTASGRLERATQTPFIEATALTLLAGPDHRHDRGRNFRCHPDRGSPADTQARAR